MPILVSEKENPARKAKQFKRRKQKKKGSCPRESGNERLDTPFEQNLQRRDADPTKVCRYCMQEISTSFLNFCGPCQEGPFHALCHFRHNLAHHEARLPQRSTHLRSGCAQWKKISPYEGDETPAEAEGAGADWQTKGPNTAHVGKKLPGLSFQDITVAQ